MGVRCFIRKKFRHRIAIALWHKGVLAALVAALLDGDSMKESTPQHAEMQLFLAGKCQLKIVDLQDAGVAVGVDQQLLVGSIVKKKLL